MTTANEEIVAKIVAMIPEFPDPTAMLPVANAIYKACEMPRPELPVGANSWPIVVVDEVWLELSLSYYPESKRSDIATLVRRDPRFAELLAHTESVSNMIEAVDGQIMTLLDTIASENGYEEGDDE